MKSIKIFAPATVANLSCGFDVLGCCLDNVGDEMVISITSGSGVKITKIEGADLPLETNKNVAGVAVEAMLKSYNQEIGVEIEIHKKIKAGSGIGSSAASSAGAVWAVNHLLDSPFSNQQLVQFAMEGEKLASGNAHADNVAPALLGGFTLVRSYNPLDVIKLHTPEHLVMTVIHPQIEVKTSDSRSVIKHKVNLKQAIHQWGNVGGLVAGLFTEDYNLIGRSLEDVIIEPLRSILIPEFKNVKEAAIVNGALGCGISGSGPSIFALSKGMETANKVAEAIDKVYQKTGLDFDIHISKINDQGVKIIN
ncbi:homoserine kinase [Aquimarina sp. 2201CG5-10]|uniref:homoserine kinase n=1 Tax=Aquimarina callyspongiae TaxID=3098150 RepID=UPI002AB54DAC|nr:homoserine kinase [Aquimarina sp. 2201CG5-10]MDY8135808.1 homoserine kinase [Aquimarina sp. 2201CG5-10]